MTVIYLNKKYFNIFHIMSNLSNDLHLAMHGLQKMRCRNNNPIFLFNVSSNSFENIPPALCNAQDCSVCSQHYGKIKKGFQNKHKPLHPQGQGQFVLAQNFVLQIVNKIRPLTTNQKENIKNTIKCFDEMINMINSEKEKLRTIGEYNGLSFQQSVFLQNIKKDQQKLITISLLNKINLKLNQSIKYRYDQMFETLDKKIFKDMESQLSNYYCKHIDILAYSPLKRAIQNQENQKDQQQERQKKYLQYFGRPPLSPKTYQQKKEAFGLQIEKLRKLRNYSLANNDSESYFNNYGDDYDYDYLNDAN